VHLQVLNAPLIAHTSAEPSFAVCASSTSIFPRSFRYFTGVRTSTWHHNNPKSLGPRVCIIPPNNSGVVELVSSPRSALKIIARAVEKGLTFCPREKVFTPAGSNSVIGNQCLALVNAVLVIPHGSYSRRHQARERYYFRRRLV
jgi:hypothetical protein